jgi:undecaprenyl-diphosphatase
LAELLEILKAADQELFLFLNGMHTPALDGVFWLISTKWVWIPLYLYIFYLLLQTYGYASWWRIGIAIGATIFLSDFVASGVFKPFFERLRPCYAPQLEGLVHVPYGCGGRYGFASSHASNSFAVAMLAILSLKPYRGFMGKANAHWNWLWLWAALVSYSRIYLGVHYPGDILAGAAIGILAATIGFQVLKCTTAYSSCPRPV